MKKSIVIFCPHRLTLGVFFLALFCGAYPPSSCLGASPYGDSAFDMRKARAIAALENKAYAEAYTSFMILLREHPDDEQVVVGLAHSAFGAKKYGQAMLAYERLADRYPHDTGLRLQLARVYILLGDKESARGELDAARRYSSDISEKDIADVITALANSASRVRLHGRVASGVLYDSNVNQGPKSDVVSLGIFESLRIDGVKRQESWGGYLSAALDGGYRLAEEGALWVVADVNGYQRWNFAEDLPSNNSFTWGRGALGLRFIGEQSLLELRGKLEQGTQRHDTQKEQTVTGSGGEALFAWATEGGMQFITRASLEYRDNSTDHYRNGTYWWTGQYLRLFLGKSNHELLLGGRMLGAETSFNDYGYTGWEASSSMRVHLPYSVDFIPFAAYKKETYRGPGTALETRDRKDDQWRLGATISWEVATGFFFDVGYSYVTTSSTCNLYDYSQNVISTGVAWNF